MAKSLPNKKLFALSVALAAGVSTSVPVLAAPDSALALEEVVVTAQKREESLQDVPIAITAVSGDTLRAGNVKNLQDLSASVPNLYVAESFAGDAMFVRGLGSGQSNVGFEQAVGQVVDGFFYGRSRFSRISFLDVQRVEVLKGPQGSLIGKNTTAGAINITTARPTDEYEGWITGLYEFEADEGYDVEGAVSGPLTDALRGRLAFKYSDRDGFIENTTTGEDDVSREDLLLRATLAWDVSDNVEMMLQYQYGDLDHEGGNNQYSFCDKTTDQNGPAPGLGGAPGENLTDTLSRTFGDDCRANYKRTGAAPKNGKNVEGKETEFDTYAFTINWELEAHTITSLTGYATYDYVDLQDGDRSPAEAVLPEFAEDYEQWTQEIRIASALGEDYDYIAGLYFMDKEQDTDYLLHFNIPPTVQSRNVFTNEEGTTYAIFGQYTRHLNEAWDVSLGGRYTYEDKEATSIQYGGALYSTVPDPGCTSPVPGVCDTHQLKDDFDEDDFSPTINVQWRPTDDAMYYASIRRGFKAGGFDHFLVGSNSDPDLGRRFVFDSEDVTAFELGTKLTLADGAAQLNAAVFRSEFDDLQLASFLDPSSAINTVTNASGATSQGAELDITWRATRALTLFGAVAYLDSTYDDYDDAPCYSLQTAAEGCVNNRQDLSDKDLQFASDWKASASAEYVWSLAGDLELIGFIQVLYVDEFPLSPDLDPKLVQDEYVKVDARIALTNLENTWEVALIGRNLDDETTTSYGDDIPGQAGSVWRSVDAPRAIALQATFRY